MKGYIYNSSQWHAIQNAFVPWNLAILEVKSPFKLIISLVNRFHNSFNFILITFFFMQPHCTLTRSCSFNVNFKSRWFIQPNFQTEKTIWLCSTHQKFPKLIFYWIKTEKTFPVHFVEQIDGSTSKHTRTHTQLPQNGSNYQLSLTLFCSIIKLWKLANTPLPSNVRLLPKILSFKF